MFSKIEECIEDLKQGKMVIVVDDENRENEGDIVFLAEYATYENVNFMTKYAKGLICVPMSDEREENLGLLAMTMKNTDLKGTAFTVTIDSKIGTTGISVQDRLQTIIDLADFEKTENDFTKPGHIFPLVAKKKGVLEREGHTEAIVDLAIIAGAKPIGVICEILKDDGTMARLADLEIFAEEHQLKIISIEDLIVYRKKMETLMKVVAEAPMITSRGEFKIIGFSNEIDDKEHIALIKGNIENQENILVRVHSECLTGDVFASMRCECGTQLGRAMEEIEKNGSGVILYLRQEGRGIGITNKIKAYALQSKGSDTVDANLKLGFEEDLRDYAVASQMLKALNVKSIRLLSNNPKKNQGLIKYGTKINSVESLEVGIHELNKNYMETKKNRMGHTLKTI